MKQSLGDGYFREASFVLVDCQMYPGRQIRFPVSVFYCPDGSTYTLPDNTICDWGSDGLPCRMCFKALLARMQTPPAP